MATNDLADRVTAIVPNTRVAFGAVCITIFAGDLDFPEIYSDHQN